MRITLTPDMERTLTEQARKLGITPEQLVVDSLKERLASVSAVPESQGTLADFLHGHIARFRQPRIHPRRCAYVGK